MRTLVPVYRPRASALHTRARGRGRGLLREPRAGGRAVRAPARAGGGDRGGRGCGRRVRRGSEIARAAWLSLPLALLMALINPLVYQEGDTLLVRGGEFLGRRWDITLEAFAAGGLNGLRIVALHPRLRPLLRRVDPDELLKLFRRVSYRSALTASWPRGSCRCSPATPAAWATPRAAARSRRGASRSRGRRWRARSTAPWTSRRRSRCAATRPRAGRGARAAPWSRHDLRLRPPRRAGRRRGRRPDRRRRASSSSTRWSRSRRRPRAGAVRGDRSVSRCAARRPGGAAGGGAWLTWSSRRASATATRARASPSLRDVSLRIEEGSFCVLAGVSGSGKSTLLRALCGLVPHFHGGEAEGELRSRA